MTLSPGVAAALFVMAVLVVPPRRSHRVSRVVSATTVAGGRSAAAEGGRATSWWRGGVPTFPARSARPPVPVRAEAETESLLAFLDVMAPALRAGRGADDAARMACSVVEGGEVVTALREALSHGESVGAVLDRYARTHGDVRLFARAWHLSSLTGCPLADTIECVTRLVRARLGHRRKVETASAGARASIRILTLLPLGGPLLAFFVGVDPVATYLTSPTAWGCLALGALLVVVGRRWVTRLVTSVARGPVLGSPT